MLYPTSNQPLVLGALFLCGLFSGVIFDFFKILSTLTRNDKFAIHFFDFVATIFSCLLLFFTNLWLNYGQFRIYVVVVYLLSFSLERILSKFFWTKLLSKWYSNITTRGKLERKKKKNN